MQKREYEDQLIFKALKAYRTAIRLKYSLMADDEINETLPKIEERARKFILEGKEDLLELEPSRVFDEVE